MISREEVERLAQLKSDTGVVSAYIGIDPRFRHDLDHHITQAKGALKRAERTLTHTGWRDALAREGERILKFLPTWELRGRGVVIFSSQPANIWEVLPVEVYIPTFIDIDATTKTAVLTRLLNEYPRLAIVVIQRDEAKLYLTEQRLSEQRAQVVSDVPGQHVQGGWAQARFERHIEFHVAEHLTRVVQELKDLNQRQPFKSLIIGGTEKTATEFLNMLPPVLAQKSIGTFAIDFKHEPEKDILERARQVHEEHERKIELQLVQQAMDGAKSGGQGALGVEQTLRAITENRVHSLLLVDPLAIKGFACSECDYFAERKFSACPVCGAKPLEQDISDRAVEKAFLAGAEINTVYGKAADQLRAEGGVGALLRF